MTGHYTAKRLPRDPGVSGWQAILSAMGPNGAYQPPLEADTNCDWLIIGAGFAGLSAARRLTQLRPDDDITIIDAARIGQGPAGRNSGFMIDLPHELSSDDYTSSLDNDRQQIAFNRRAIAFAKDVADEYNLPQGAVDACGRVNGAATPSGMGHNQQYAKHLAGLGEACEELDAAAMKALTGSDFYKGGLYLSGAVLLQPAQYIQGLGAGLGAGLAAKIKIHEDTPALSIARHASTWQVTTPKGKITSPKIILAVNGHAESFGFYQRQFMHIFTYASMTEALTPQQAAILGGEQTWGITPADPMGSTVRRIKSSAGSRILIRNRWSFDPSMEVSDRRIARYGIDHDKGFLRRFPMLGDVAMDYRWGGRLCLSYNSVPAFGELDDGIFSACCQNGLGTAKGTLSGIAAAELAAETDSELARDMLSLPQPQKLPPTPLAWLGATAVIKWREWKARGEI